MANTPRRVVGYGLSDALPNIPPAPIVAKRAPTTADTGYLIGTIWVYTTGNAAYILVSIANALATWNLLEASAGPGIFTTLTSTGATTLATTGASVNSFGNITGATSLSLLVGTGNFSLDGVGASTYTIGASTTGGTIAIGGTAQTGAITLGSSSGTNIVNVGTGAGATTVNVATGATNAKTVHIADGAVANLVTIGSLTGAASTTIQSGTAGIDLFTSNTGVIILGTATMTGTITIGQSTTGQSINIGTVAGPQLVTVGSTNTTSNTTIQGGTAGITLSAPFTALPGPVYIYTGAGVPSNGLALHVGDMYINTTASTTTTRLYIASAAGTWVTFTTSA